MGIIKYFRKKYWEAAIFRGGRRIPFSCDGLTAVPDRAYLSVSLTGYFPYLYGDIRAYLVPLHLCW